MEVWKEASLIVEQHRKVRVKQLAKELLKIACIIQLENWSIKDCSIRSSYKERKGNALASGAEEGRDKLR